MFIQSRRSRRSGRAVSVPQRCRLTVSTATKGASSRSPPPQPDTTTSRPRSGSMSIQTEPSPSSTGPDVSPATPPMASPSKLQPGRPRETFRRNPPAPCGQVDSRSAPDARAAPQTRPARPPRLRHPRRTRLPALRSGRRAAALPPDEPALRANLDRHHHQPRLRRMSTAAGICTGAAAQKCTTGSVVACPRSPWEARARGDAPSARLAAARAWEGPVGPRGQAGVILTVAGGGTDFA